MPLPTFAGTVSIGSPQVVRKTYWPPIYGFDRHVKTETYGGPLTSSTVYLSYSGEVFGYTYENTTSTSSTTPGVSMNIPIGYQAEMQNAILGKLSNTAMQLMVTAAEYRKTAATLVESTNRLINAVGEIATGKPGKHLRELGITMFGNHPTRVYYRDRRGRKRVSRVWKRDKDNVELIAESATNISQRYLEARFGLMPTIYDIDGACRIIAGWDVNKVLGSLRHVQMVPEDRTYVVNDDFHKTMSGSMKVVNRLTFTMRDGFANEMNKIGMDTTHLIATAWELIPYTWLLDKFWNIGNYTMALGGARPWRFSYGSRSYKGSCKCSTTRKTKTDLFEEISSVTLSMDVFERTVLTGFPLPMVPRLVPDLGVRDALDILSLGIVKIRGVSNPSIK